MTTNATYSPEDDKIRIYPSARLDADEYQRAKKAGYRWAPMQKLFYATWSPAAEDFALELAGEIEDEDKSLVERAEERAERFEDYSESRLEDANQAKAAVDRIADGIPFGQPILVGHHSEKHARKDAQRIENGMRKAVNCWKQSGYWKERAAGALHHAKYKERPDVRARRIKTLEADLRKSIASYTPLVTKDRPTPSYTMQQKWGEAYPHDRTLTREERDAVPAKQHVFCGPPGRGGTWVAVEDLEKLKAYSARYEEHLSNRLEYEYGMLGEQIGAETFSARFDYAVGGKITAAREPAILTILKLNKKDGQVISVSTNSKRWTRIVPVEDIKTYEPPEEGAAEKIKAATKRTGPCNYPGEGFACCTLAEWRKIYSDYKSTIHRIEATETTAAHYVRYAIGSWLHLPVVPTGDETAKYNTRHSYYPVYITDEKRKDPPPLDPKTPPPPAMPALEYDEARIQAQHEALARSNERRAAEQQAAAPFEALADSLKTGVKVVTANQLFPTPHDLAQRVVELADIQDGMSVLEPSAGTGALLNAITTRPDVVTAVEISSTLADRLRETQNSKTVVWCCDFLEAGQITPGSYDRVIMNPPFENGADIKHILHARKFLRPGGRLVAICANGPRQNDKLQPLADSWEELPAGTFEGTQVRAVLLTMGPDPEICRDCNQPLGTAESMVRNHGELSHLDPCPGPVKKCPNCQRELQPVALFEDVWGCATCKETHFLPKEDDMQPGPGKPAQSAPLLGQDSREAERMTYAGRKIEHLREPKTFDQSRVEAMPLFQDAGRQGRLI